MLELLIMSGVGVMLLGIFWAFFSQSHSDTQQMSQKLKSFQGGHLLIERLEGDLREMVWDKTRHPLKIEDEGRSITFSRADERLTKPDDIRLKSCKYHLDPATRRVYLNDEPILSTRFLDLRFELDGRDMAATPPRPGNVLRISLRGVAEELADKDPAEIPANKTTTLVAAVYLRSKTSAEMNEYWWTHTSVRPKD